METRPARADPKDLDDNEKEMIELVRARLGNNLGRKEKRQARIRVITEARRIAMIQKFRELRNAGVDFIVDRKKKKGEERIDYGGEIPLLIDPVNESS